MVDLGQAIQQEGFTKVHIYLDNNPTHKQKMLDFFQQKAQALALQVVFHYLPRYSPKLNPVEYLIHLVRQQCLHHGHHQRNLEDIEKQLTDLLHQKHFVAKDQLVNILQHIQDLIVQT